MSMLVDDRIRAPMLHARRTALVAGMFIASGLGSSCSGARVAAGAPDASGREPAAALQPASSTAVVPPAPPPPPQPALPPSPFAGEYYRGSPSLFALGTRAPRHIEDQVPTASLLKKKYDEHVASRDSQQKKRQQSCATSLGWKRPCWSLGRQWAAYVFAPPYVRRTPDESPSHAPDEDGPRVVTPSEDGPRVVAPSEAYLQGGWAPLDEVEGGQAAIDAWNARARQAASEQCTTGTCRITVRIGKEGASAGAPYEEALSLCSSWRVADVVGVPEACEPLAVWDGNRVWLPVWWSAAVTVSSSHAAMGEPDYSMRIVAAQSDLKQVMQRVSDGLRATPLQLETRQFPSGAVLGIAAPKGRSSPVLKVLREQLTVRVDIYKEGEGELGLQVTITAAVSKYNVADVRSWDPVDTFQQDQYNIAVRKALKNALTPICNGFWADNFSLHCQ